LGGGISGSGPSIFMLNEKEETARTVADIMKDIYEKLGIDYRIYVTTMNTQGVTIL
jgi:homoserine kinase